MSSLVIGVNPNYGEGNQDSKEALMAARGDRKIAASQYLKTCLYECKNKDQRNALRTVTEVLESYYFGSFTKKVREIDVKDTPILTMIGVPGAGKSWIIGKIRTWIDIRLKITDLPYFSSESYILNLN